MKQQSLRVATYNIHKGVSAFNLRNRVHDLRLALATLQADILCLQEVQEVSARNAKRFANWPIETQSAFLAGADYHCVYGRNAVYAHGHHGNAILSKFAFDSSLNHDISDHRFEQRGMLHAVLDVGGRPVHCVNVHLGLFEHSRRRQADALIALVEQAVPSDCPLVICGDFNDWNNRLTMRLTSALDVREVGVEQRTSAGAHYDLRGFQKPSRTFPSFLPWLTLDRIYVRGLRVKSSEVHGGRIWARVSDHAPLVADLVVA
ncbi:endonuclease/exonuclease/phosphatase family protein [soil metagenome]